MTERRMTEVRAEVDRTVRNRQGRNLAWWERMPMTYADWDAADRLPKEDADYRRIEEYLLARSPFLSRFLTGHRLAGQHVLDLGCGVGVLSCRLARDGAKITAADITAQAVNLTARNARAQNVSLEIVRTDAEALGFADDAFDFVLSWGVVHHSSSTERALCEIGRVLRPEGRGLIMVYHRTSVVYYLHGLFWLLARGKILHGYNLDSVQAFWVDGYYHRHFRANELAASLAAVGLRATRIVATQQDSPILPFLPTGIDRWLKKRFGWYLVAEIERSARTGIS